MARQPRPPPPWTDSSLEAAARRLEKRHGGSQSEFLSVLQRLRAGGWLPASEALPTPLDEAVYELGRERALALLAGPEAGRVLVQRAALLRLSAPNFPLWTHRELKSELARFSVEQQRHHAEVVRTGYRPPTEGSLSAPGFVDLVLGNSYPTVRRRIVRGSPHHGRLEEACLACRLPSGDRWVRENRPAHYELGRAFPFFSGGLKRRLEDSRSDFEALKIRLVEGLVSDFDAGRQRLRLGAVNVLRHLLTGAEAADLLPANCIYDRFAGRYRRVTLVPRAGGLADLLRVLLHCEHEAETGELAALAQAACTVAELRAAGRSAGCFEVLVTADGRSAAGELASAFAGSEQRASEWWRSEAALLLAELDSELREPHSFTVLIASSKRDAFDAQVAPLTQALAAHFEQHGTLPAMDGLTFAGHRGNSWQLKGHVVEIWWFGERSTPRASHGLRMAGHLIHRAGSWIDNAVLRDLVDGGSRGARRKSSESRVDQQGRARLVALERESEAMVNDETASPEDRLAAQEELERIRAELKKARRRADALDEADRSAVGKNISRAIRRLPSRSLARHLRRAIKHKSSQSSYQPQAGVTWADVNPFGPDPGT